MRALTAGASGRGPLTVETNGAKASASAITSYIDETKSDPIEAVGVGTLVRYSTQLFDSTGEKRTESRSYFDIPTSGAGTAGTHYDATKYAYDAMGRTIRTLAAHGTITRQTFDSIGRPSATWVGTNDFGEPQGSTSGPNDMTKVSDRVYDGGLTGRNSHVTLVRSWIDDTTSEDTAYVHDSRGRVRLVEGPTAPFVLSAYDNMGRTTATAQYGSMTNLNAAGSDNPVTHATDRLSLSQVDYDERGRVWRTRYHEIDPADGSDKDHLVDLTWYDDLGRVLKRKGGEYSKTLYDRIGRATHRFLLAADNDTVYADVHGVAGDVVIEEHQTVYEIDDVVMSVAIRRHHDDVDDGSGQTLGPLDTNADSDLLKVTAADLAGRAQISASWHDRFGRVTHSASYGTNGGATFDRAAVSSAPSSTNDHPVAAYTYNDAGELEVTTDAKGRKHFREFDNLGRVVREVSNYDHMVNSGNPSGSDINQTVLYEYTEGLRTKLTARQAGGPDQHTVYTYGTVKGTATGESEIATGHLLLKTAYPDSSGAADVVAHAYDAQGREIWRKDQAGNVLETLYDASGRPYATVAADIATGFDDEVERIERAYDGLGRIAFVTQYDAPSSGNVLDQVGFEYDGWGQVLQMRQDVNSALDAIDSVDDYQVSYTYAKATSGRQTVRRTGMTMPNGAAVDYVYSSTGLLDDALSRVSGVQHSSNLVSRYSYAGMGQVVRTTYPVPGMRQEVVGATAGTYPGLDRHNRPVHWTWNRPASGATYYDEQVTWDAGSNVTLRQDHIHAGFDVAYGLDDLDRVTQAQEGTWDTSAITDPTRDQHWTLDHLGNWVGHQLDLDGDGLFTGPGELDEDRDHNVVNELESRDLGGSPPVVLTQSYDPVGNLTDDGEDYKYVWDAFGRLRKILKRGDDALVTELRYNGMGILIGELYDANEDGVVDNEDEDPWYYHVWDERWRLLATYRGGDPDDEPKEQYLPHQAGFDGHGGSSYINAIILRDRDANTVWHEEADGVLEERLYYLTNWRQDVVALVTNSGHQLEQVRYSAYGVPFGLPSGDMNSNGSVSLADVEAIEDLIDVSGYSSLADLDGNGVVNSADVSIAQTGRVLGRGVQTDQRNRTGYAGYQSLLSGARGLQHVRHRVYDPGLGRWLSRDPLGYVDGPNRSAYVHARPIPILDPSGLHGVCGVTTTVSFAASCEFARGCGDTLHAAVLAAIARCVASGGGPAIGAVCNDCPKPALFPVCNVTKVDFGNMEAGCSGTVGAWPSGGKICVGGVNCAVSGSARVTCNPCITIVLP